MKFREWLKINEVAGGTPPTTFRAVILGPSGIFTRPLLSGSPRDIANAAAYATASSFGSQLHKQIFRGAQGPQSSGQILPDDIGNSKYSIEASRTIPIDGTTPEIALVKQARDEIHEEIRKRVKTDPQFSTIETDNPRNPPKFKTIKSPGQVTVVAYYYSSPEYNLSPSVMHGHG